MLLFFDNLFTVCKIPNMNKNLSSLRTYQRDAITQIADAHKKYRNVAYILPTGGGKTVIMAGYIAFANLPTCVIAHRSELVSQSSLALARLGIKHRVIAAKETSNDCIAWHISEGLENHVVERSPICVASVDTLVRRDLHNLFDKTMLLVMDECHHVLTNNKWGAAVRRFKYAKVLGLTATFERADGMGLGVQGAGIFQHAIEGPSMLDLMEHKYLSDYNIMAPESHVRKVRLATNGDFNHRDLVDATRNSTIIGDVVTTYSTHANGKAAVCFVPSLDIGDDQVRAFTKAGISAALVTGKTNPHLRRNLLKKFRAGTIKVLVNVDLFGEGVDIPMIEVVIMARMTASYPLYKQQFGRALRVWEGKSKGLIIDHVGNWMLHGLPEQPRELMFHNRKQAVGIPRKGENLRVCTSCLKVYVKYLSTCPYCGISHKKVGRVTVVEAEGVLSMLEADVLNRIRMQIKSLSPSYPMGATPQIKHRLDALHEMRLKELANLKDAMRIWAHKCMNESGLNVEETQRKFFHDFGIDVLSAQTLRRQDAVELRRRILREG